MASPVEQAILVGNEQLALNSAQNVALNKLRYQYLHHDIINRVTARLAAIVITRHYAGECDVNEKLRLVRTLHRRFTEKTGAHHLRK